jgi:DNA-binding CsgD family transcriptional regulator/tetratricopeptide (TPR) repeat protein
MAWSLTSLAGIAHDMGDLAAARHHEEESLAIFRALDDRQGLTLPLYGLGRLALRQGDLATARSRFEESLALNRELGETWMSAQSLNCLGEIARMAGDLDLAAVRYEESLEIFRSMGSTAWCAMVLHNLGHVLLRRGDPRRAAACFEESLALGTPRGGSVLGLAGLAAVALAEERPEGAARLFGAVEALMEQTGARIEGVDRLEYERNIEAVRARLDADALAMAWAGGRALSREQALDEALSGTIPAVPPTAEHPAANRTSLLTQRQREVAILIARGLTNRQIAHRLTISEGTVGSHVEHILDRLGCQSRAQVAVWVVEQGLAGG